MKFKKPTMKQVAIAIAHLQLDINALKEIAHEPKEFVCCDKCGCKLKKDEV